MVEHATPSIEVSSFAGRAFPYKSPIMLQSLLPAVAAEVKAL